MASLEVMYCIGCGDDISKFPTRRRSLCSDSKGDPEPREQALSGWITLLSMQLQLQGISIHDTTIDLENPGRMCKPCFKLFLNYQKLHIELEKNISVALLQIDFTLKEGTSECAAEAIVDTPSSSCVTPPRKKSRASSFPPAVPLTTDAFSPSVTVNS